jgi:hypothetical protein
LPNVYYSALLNHCVEQMHARGHDSLLLVASDVGVTDAAALVARAQAALTDPRIGVYGPACRARGHRHMDPRRGGRLREVPFLEGFCFAARSDLLDTLCPVDTQKNLLGWGLDVHLGYLALARGQTCVVDDTILVVHPRSTGYNVKEARKEYRRYKRAHAGLRRFVVLVELLFAKRSELGARLLRAAVRQ